MNNIEDLMDLIDSGDPYAIQHLIDSANSGDPDAIYEASCRMLNGDKFEKNPQMAYDNFAMLAQIGYENANIQIAKMYYYGYFGKEKIQDGLQILITASQNGNFVATYELGVIYEHGIGCNADISAAMCFYENSADTGYRPASIALNRLLHSQSINNYQFSNNISINNQQKENSPETLFNLGIAYLSGKGVKKDTAKGQQLLNKAGELGYLNAYIELGYFYLLDGNYKCELYNRFRRKLTNFLLNLVSPYTNINLAIFYFNAALNAGCKEALVHLAIAKSCMIKSLITLSSSNTNILEFLYSDMPTIQIFIQEAKAACDYIDLAKSNGITKIEEAESLVFQSTAEAYEFIAFYELMEHMNFKVYRHFPIDKDLRLQESIAYLSENKYYMLACDYCQKNREILRSLAKQDDTSAQRDLGMILKNGDISGANWEEGEYWLKIAAEKGDVIAMKEYADYLLGFYNGTKNINLALELLDKAAKSGNQDCLSRYAEVLVYGLGSQKESYDLDLGISILKNQCASNHPESLYRLGRLYDDPRTKKHKTINPLTLYKRAAELGHINSKRILFEKYGYKYSHEELEAIFMEVLKYELFNNAPCLHCGSTFPPTPKSFLGISFFQCPICNGKHKLLGMTRVKI